MSNKSIYREYIEDYINFRIANNYKAASLHTLYDFDDFLYKNCYEKNVLSKEIIDKWDEKRLTETKVGQSLRIRTVRGFCKYLNACGIDAHISTNYVKPEKNMPFVFDRDDMPSFFCGIDKYCLGIRTKHYRYMIPVILKLMYTSGLRIGEACNIKINDIDMENRRIHIRDSKNLKSRYAYISVSTADLLKKYMKKMKSDGLFEVWLFPNSISTNHILKSVVDHYFKKAVKTIGGFEGSHYPVPHSLRHSFTVHIINDWVNSGRDLNELMPYLENQLGHKGLNETMYYYHMVFESYEIIQKKTKDVYPEVKHDEKRMEW